jgi:hypothetical protein
VTRKVLIVIRDVGAEHFSRRGAAAQRMTQKTDFAPLRRCEKQLCKNLVREVAKCTLQLSVPVMLVS